MVHFEGHEPVKISSMTGRSNPNVATARYQAALSGFGFLHRGDSFAALWRQDTLHRRSSVGSLQVTALLLAQLL